MFDYSKYMQLALDEAKRAYAEGEVPVGAVVVDGAGQVISRARNKSENSGNPTHHAEIIAMSQALKQKSPNNKFLEGCTLYVTLEPCPMCAQAISYFRIKNLIYAASDEKFGGVENGTKIYQANSCFHKPEIISGIMQDECKEILQSFFKELRSRAGS